MSTVTIRNLILSLLTFMLSAGIFGYVVFKIASERTLLMEQVSTLQEQQGQENAFFRLQNIAEESETDRAELQSYFLLNESDSINFLNKVETLAPQSGVTLTTESLTQLPETEAGDNWIEVEFSYSGSKSSVNRFTTLLENLPYVSYVTEYTVQSETLNNWEAKIKLRVYVLAYDS